MHPRNRLQTSGPQKPRHAFPPWFTPKTLDGKQGGILFKCGICLTEPSTLNKLIYPTTLLDDVSRPRIFDAHVFRVTGQSLWPPSDLTTRIEIHVEHGSIRFYRAIDVARYRVAKLRTEEPGTVEVSKATGMPLMFSIHADVMAYASTVIPANASPQPLPLPLPLCLDLSLRDITDVWFDQNSRALLRLRFQSGLSIAFACRAGDDLLTCVFHRLRALSVYATLDEANVLKPLHEAARTLAAAVAVESAHNSSLPAAARIAQRTSNTSRGAALGTATAEAGALTLAELEANPYAQWTPALFPRDSDDLAQAVAALDRLLADSDDEASGDGAGGGSAAPVSVGFSACDYRADEADHAAVRHARSVILAGQKAERARVLSELVIPKRPELEETIGDDEDAEITPPVDVAEAPAQPISEAFVAEAEPSTTNALDRAEAVAELTFTPKPVVQEAIPSVSAVAIPCSSVADLDTAIAELIHNDPCKWRTAAASAPAGSRAAIDLPATVTRERGGAASASAAGRGPARGKLSQ